MPDTQLTSYSHIFYFRIMDSQSDYVRLSGAPPPNEGDILSIVGNQIDSSLGKIELPTPYTMSDRLSILRAVNSFLDDQNYPIQPSYKEAHLLKFAMSAESELHMEIAGSTARGVSKVLCKICSSEKDIELDKYIYNVGVADYEGVMQHALWYLASLVA